MSSSKKTFGTKSNINMYDMYVLKQANHKTVATKELNNEIMILKQLREMGFSLCGKIIDYKESHYIKMARIDGEPLSELIRKTFDLKDRKKNSSLAYSVASTLAEFYRSGLYHNDLATTNLLLENSTGLVYLIDYGRTSSDGSISNDLGYFLDSIIKINCPGGLLHNAALLITKCRFFIDVFSNFHKSKYWVNTKIPISFYSVLSSFIQFQCFILLKRRFSISHKLLVVPIMIIVPIICILFRYR